MSRLQEPEPRGRRFGRGTILKGLVLSPFALAGCARAANPTPSSPRPSEIPRKLTEAPKPEQELPLITEFSFPFDPTPDMNIQLGFADVMTDEKGEKKLHGGFDAIKGKIDDSSTWRPFILKMPADGETSANPKDKQGNATLSRFNFKGSVIYMYAGHQSEITEGIPENSTGNWKRMKKGDKIGIAGSTGAKDPDWIHAHIRYFDASGTSIDPFDIRGKRDDYPNPSFTNGKTCGKEAIWANCPKESLPSKPKPVEVFQATPTSAPKDQTKPIEKPAAAKPVEQKPLAPDIATFDNKASGSMPISFKYDANYWDKPKTSSLSNASVVNFTSKNKKGDVSLAGMSILRSTAPATKSINQLMKETFDQIATDRRIVKIEPVEVGEKKYPGFAVTLDPLLDEEKRFKKNVFFIDESQGSYTAWFSADPDEAQKAEPLFDAILSTVSIDAKQISAPGERLTRNNAQEYISPKDKYTILTPRGWVLAEDGLFYNNKSPEGLSSLHTAGIRILKGKRLYARDTLATITARLKDALPQKDLSPGHPTSKPGELAKLPAEWVSYTYPHGGYQIGDMGNLMPRISTSNVGVNVTDVIALRGEEVWVARLAISGHIKDQAGEMQQLAKIIDTLQLPPLTSTR